ncbi:PAAR domain-containing protein [Burkholderia stabilis]|uniref:PAAR domain-containing protein n=1 Tax=Burkholderia stabilis TaxID=95485 RepID=A0A4Q2AC25_9BURK|nr:PAAR domain-containing protein [Burkholderia stabilis]RXV67176.1 PAAR domain-containing protein [Burkholderia stabilis]
MRRTAVRDRDPTTTGGFVIAVASTIFDNGKHVAIDGDEATCANCKGAFKILGSATRMTCHGQRVVLDGDPVLCPCGKNKVITGCDSKIFYEEGNALTDTASTIEARPFMPIAPSQYDETVKCMARVSTLAGYPYYIETADGRAYSGRVNNSGMLPRIDTRTAAGDYVVYWGDEAIGKQYEA